MCVILSIQISSIVHRLVLAIVSTYIYISLNVTLYALRTWRITTPITDSYSSGLEFGAFGGEKDRHSGTVMFHDFAYLKSRDGMLPENIS
jgi:hypothetical protein